MFAALSLQTSAQELRDQKPHSHQNASRVGFTIAIARLSPSGAASAAKLGQTRPVGWGPKIPMEKITMNPSDLCLRAGITRLPSGIVLACAP